MIVVIAPQVLHSKMMSYFEEQVFWIEMPEIETILYDLRKHTDMGIHMTPKGLVVEPTVFDVIKQRLISVGFTASRIYKGDTKLAYQYPADIAYNCLAIGNQFFYHAKTDPKIIAIYEASGFYLNPVKQGYIKCATLVVDQNTVITEDLNLYRAFIKANIKTLLIPKGEILLKGFEYGFIGGTGGLYHNKLFLNGSLEYHSYRNEIVNFIKSKGVEIIELHEDKLEDCGSIFIFDF